MWNIHKIQYTIHTEGQLNGTPAVVITFAGCNLACSFCTESHQHDGTGMSLFEIINEVKRYPNAQLVVLTGGEPALQVNQDIINALKRTGKRIAIETNGTKPLPEGIDWVTLSPKNAFAGGDTDPVVVTDCDELKVVYLGQDLKQYDTINARHRFLQPCYCDEDDLRQYTLRSCISAVMANPKWRLSLQTSHLLNL